MLWPSGQECGSPDLPGQIEPDDAPIEIGGLGEVPHPYGEVTQLVHDSHAIIPLPYALSTPRSGARRRKPIPSFPPIHGTSQGSSRLSGQLSTCVMIYR
jgi:hypothetical protein